MKKTVHKLFFAWDFEKEEKWLNEMSAKGLQLCDVSLLRYVFEEGEPCEYLYRLELLDSWPTSAMSEQYIHFLEDTGVEHVGSLMRWVYFRKKAGGTGFDLFSDIESRIRHLNRIIVLLSVAGFINIPNGIAQISFGISNGVLPNLLVGILCIVLSAFVGFGVYRLWRMRHKLTRENVLHE